MVTIKASVGTLAIVAAAAGLTSVGCGSSSKSASSSGAGATTAGGASTPAPNGPAQSSAKVGISNFKFVAPTLVVKSGAKVTFTNSDSAPHTATASDSSFDTGTLNKGQSKTVALSKAGTYAYVCQFHPFMRGSITVK